MAEAPWWLRGVARAERTIGGPLARATNSGAGAEVMLAVERARRVVARAGGSVVDGVVHLVHLPSRRDVQLLRVELERLHRTVEDLTHTVEEEEDDDGRPRR